MNLDITLVPLGNIARFIPVLLPYLEESAQRSRGRVVVDDILGSLLSGRMALWAVFDRDTSLVVGQFITEVKQYAQLKMLAIPYAAMEPNIMVEVEDAMQDIAGRYAVAHDCAGIEFVGRPGWKKHATKYGYSANSVTYQKFFE